MFGLRWYELTLLMSNIKEATVWDRQAVTSDGVLYIQSSSTNHHSGNSLLKVNIKSKGHLKTEYLIKKKQQNT